MAFSGRIFYHQIGITQSSALVVWITGICIVLLRTDNKDFLLHGLLSSDQIQITSIVCIMSPKFLEKRKRLIVCISTNYRWEYNDNETIQLWWWRRWSAEVWSSDIFIFEVLLVDKKKFLSSNTQPSGPLLHWLTGICIVLSRTSDKYFLLHGLLSRNHIKITSIVCIMSMKLLEKWKSWKFACQLIIGGNTMIMKLFNDDDDAADRRKFGAPIFLFSNCSGWTTKDFK